MSTWGDGCSCFETLEGGEDAGKDDGNRIYLFILEWGTFTYVLVTWTEASFIILIVPSLENLDSSSSSSSSLLPMLSDTIRKASRLSSKQSPDYEWEKYEKDVECEKVW